VARVLYLIHCVLVILHDWIHTLLELTEPTEPELFRLVVLDEEELEDWLGANNIVLRET